MLVPRQVNEDKRAALGRDLGTEEFSVRARAKDRNHSETALGVQKLADKRNKSNPLSRQLELPRQLDELNGQLSSFSFSPQFSIGVKKTFRVSWVPGMGSRRFGGGPFADAAELAESENAMRVIRLMEQGLLSSIRKCMCGKWLVARMKKQTFCSTACRQAEFRSTERYKAKRREYMRNFYDKTMRKSRRDRKVSAKNTKGRYDKCRSTSAELYGS